MLCCVYAVYSRVMVEDTVEAGSVEDVTEELDELRRSFCARLRSETLQRKSDNLEKDSKINRLESILESQLDREKAKDRKIAELEQKVEAMVQLKKIEMPKQRQTVEFPEEQTTPPSGDAGADSGIERGRCSGNVKQIRTRDNAAQVATARPLVSETEDDPDSSQVKDEIQKVGSFEEGNKGTALNGQSAPAPAKQISRMQKLSSVLKRKSRQNNVI